MEVEITPFEEFEKSFMEDEDTVIELKETKGGSA